MVIRAAALIDYLCCSLATRFAPPFRLAACGVQRYASLSPIVSDRFVKIVSEAQFCPFLVQPEQAGEDCVVAQGACAEVGAPCGILLEHGPTKAAPRRRVNSRLQIGASGAMFGPLCQSRAVSEESSCPYHSHRLASADVKPGPFRSLKTLPEIIRLANMMYILNLLSLQNVQNLLRESRTEVSHSSSRLTRHSIRPSRLYYPIGTAQEGSFEYHCLYSQRQQARHVAAC